MYITVALVLFAAYSLFIRIRDNGFLNKPTTVASIAIATVMFFMTREKQDSTQYLLVYIGTAIYMILFCDSVINILYSFTNKGWPERLTYITLAIIDVAVLIIPVLINMYNIDMFLPFYCLAFVCIVERLFFNRILEFWKDKQEDYQLNVAIKEDKKEKRAFEKMSPNEKTDFLKKKVEEYNTENGTKIAGPVEYLRVLAIDSEIKDIEIEMSNKLIVKDIVNKERYDAASVMCYINNHLSELPYENRALFTTSVLTNINNFMPVKSYYAYGPEPTNPEDYLKKFATDRYGNVKNPMRDDGMSLNAIISYVYVYKLDQANAEYKEYADNASYKYYNKIDNLKSEQGAILNGERVQA